MFSLAYLVLLQLKDGLPCIRGQAIEIPGNVLIPFAANDGFAVAMRTFMSVAVTLVYPLLCIPCRSIIDHLIQSESSAAQNPRMRHFAVTLIIVGFTLLLSELIADLSKVLGITGASFGTLVAYVLPPLCFLRLRLRQPLHQQGETRIRALFSAGMLLCTFPLVILMLWQQFLTGSMFEV